MTQRHDTRVQHKGRMHGQDVNQGTSTTNHRYQPHPSSPNQPHPTIQNDMHSNSHIAPLRRAWLAFQQRLGGRRSAHPLQTETIHAAALRRAQTTCTMLAYHPQRRALTAARHRLDGRLSAHPPNVQIIDLSVTIADCPATAGFGRCPVTAWGCLYVHPPLAEAIDLVGPRADKHMCGGANTPIYMNVGCQPPL